ncbi:tetratricopeptide repeat protein 23-like isoform X3 [Hemicordylus capensis]|uniref:tetratricopeptide repeat protein 23-like isoform X3 n=1 Tax=Hemicordylus capensis TaxID=884348 RepID=UPI0023032FB9|nr:tetratricopeptide repeat protein 23-like isoform X3 [Hemicordylus capensis]
MLSREVDTMLNSNPRRGWRVAYDEVYLGSSPHSATNQTYKAHRELIQCTALARIVYGHWHWRTAQAHAHLAHSYLTLQGMSWSGQEKQKDNGNLTSGLPVQAIQHANSAKCTIFKGEGTPSSSSEERREILSTLLTIYYTLGVAEWMRKNGKESYGNLQKAERIMEDLQGSGWRGTPQLKVSERDLSAALGRASLQQNKLMMAVKHFEKAIDAVISAEGETAPELISLYQEIAQVEQMKKNHKKCIGYLLQAHSVALAVGKKCSPEAASIALLLGKAYAATGEEKHGEAAEMYFRESLATYKVALGPDHPQMIDALEEFSKWLICVGKREQAYDLLKESFESQSDPCSDFNEKAAERFYIMGCICLAEENMREAYQLLSKCVQIQTAVYGPRHRKSKEIQKLLDMLKMSPGVLEGTKPMK